MLSMVPTMIAAHVAHSHVPGPPVWVYAIVIIVVVASVLRWATRGGGGAAPGGQRSGSWQPPPAPPWQWTEQDERSWQARGVAPFARQAQGLPPYHDSSRDHLRPSG
jgi:hypothetical protein